MAKELDKVCLYCEAAYHKNGEHVFPYGLGGQNLYMDCVCDACNNYFAGLERELYQKSFVGLLRSMHGVDGYSPDPINRSPFKAPVLLCMDKNYKLVFEVGQYQMMKVGMRPQIYFYRDRYFLEGGSHESTALFVKEFSKWKKENCVLTGRVEGQILMRKFELTENRHKSIACEVKQQSKKAIQFCSIPSDHKLYSHLQPRLYIDDDKKLKIRAKTFRDAEVFLGALLDDIQVNNHYSSLEGIDLDHPIVDVGFSFNALKFEQGLLKIGLNCLVHYYPGAKDNIYIKPIVNFVMGRNTHEVNRHLDKREALKDSKDGHHNIFFFQGHEAVHVRISLFNGEFAFAFQIDNLKIMGANTYSRLLVDYKNRINTLQDQNAFLLSFQRQKSKA